jgi:hypothetical protein
LAVCLALLLPVPARSGEHDEKPFKKIPLKLRVNRGGFVALENKLGRITKGGTVRAYGQEIRLTVERDRKGEHIVVNCGKVRSRHDSFPVFVPLETKRGVHLTPWTGGEYLCISAACAEVRIDGQAFQFVDADMDGKLTGGEGDGFAGPDSSTLGPCRGVLWTRSGRYRFSVHRDRKTILLLWKFPVLHTSDPAILKAWCFLNSQRQRIGSLPVEWDGDMAKGCHLHARYCAVNDYGGHDEETGNPGYSKEGARAGVESVVGSRYSAPRMAIAEQLDTAFHCSKVIHASLEKTAFALVETRFVMNTERGRRWGFDEKRIGTRGPVKFFWPPHGAQDVSPSFNEAGEIPMPEPGRETEWLNSKGRAVFAHVGGEGRFRIELEDPRGAIVPGTHTSPQDPVSGKFIPGNFGLVCLLPDAPLSLNSWHRARVYELSDAGESPVFSWRFRTR